MNVDCFLKRFADVLFNDRNDGLFESLKVITGGTTSARIAKFINFAVSQMGPEEGYVEVGVFTGGTLSAANYTNNKLAVGIDSYDADNLIQMTGMPASSIRDRCLHNIQSLGDATRLIEKDFRDVTKEEIGFPVAVSFIDGKHDYVDVTKNLEWLEPLLADHAVLIFDDVNYLEVSKAIFDWAGAHKDNYQLLAYAMPYFQDSHYTTSLVERFLNNGVAVMLYHRTPHSYLGFMEVNKTKGEAS